MAWPGVKLYNANKGLRYGNENFTQDFYNNRWHGAGTSNTNPSVNVGGDQNYYINSWYVESGAYFRIRNVQLGWTLPSEYASKAGPSKGQGLRECTEPGDLYQIQGLHTRSRRLTRKHRHRQQRIPALGYL